MRILKPWMWLALLAVAILFAAGGGLASGRNARTSGVKAADMNPNKFYLHESGKGYSIRYTYDPHAADLWMFRTAEGHLMINNEGKSGGTNGVRNARRPIPTP